MSAVSGLVLFFLIPFIGIHENLIMHVAMFFGNVACPVFLAYSHIGLRNFIFQRFRNFKTQFFELDSPSNNSMSQITKQTEMEENPQNTQKGTEYIQNNAKTDHSSVVSFKTENEISDHGSLNTFMDHNHACNLERCLPRRHSY